MDATIMDIMGIGSGVLLVLLGLFVATRRPAQAVNASFGVFAVALGLAFATIYLFADPGSHAAPVAWPSVVAMAAWLVAGVALVDAGRRLPLAGRAPMRRHVAVSVMVVVVLLFGAAASLRLNLDDAVFMAQDGARLGAWHSAVLNVLHALHWGVLYLLALRFPRADGDRTAAREVALMSAGLLVYPAIWAGNLALRGLAGLEPWIAPFALLALAAAVGLAASWLRNAEVGAEPRLARNVALWGLALPLAGAASILAIGQPWEIVTHVTLSGSRIVGVAVLAYVILRHQVLGIDVKVRWTISRSTIAATFLAVFFTTTELAQAYLADFAGSQYLGIVAAGGLVFAIAPLQRAADRLAARAVPAASSGSAREVYRHALRVALADGELSADEERALARLQRELDLDPEVALDVRHDVEREVRAG